MASSSSSSLRSFDVYLSFRGEDTRKGFVSHLYKEFKRKGLKIFRDDEELQKDRSISPELLQAIRESKFAVVVISQNYASSSWCLDELLEIVKCEEKGSLKIFPVFYEVDPLDVMKQKGPFAESFQRYKDNPKLNSEKVEQWKYAMRKVATTVGENSRNWNDHSDLIKEIVGIISGQLVSTTSSDSSGLVGMDHHMAKLSAMLNLDSTDEVRMIGIWGMPGVGKTTLARYIYERICQHFHTHCFVEDVKKFYREDGPKRLQEKLLTTTLGGPLSLRSSVVGSDVIKARLGHQKVLIVIDDVDEIEQLDVLAKDTSWFGPGSRIVVTTQNVHLLIACGVEYAYEVRQLPWDSAIQLFSLYAFKQKQPSLGLEEFSCYAVKYACCLPLALRVLGSSLRGRTKKEWNSILFRCERSLNKQITDILKIGYDVLNKQEKSIFLHIACLYDGFRVEDVSRILNDDDVDAKFVIQILAAKSLIDIQYGDIKMHCLLQKMGRELVSEGDENCRLLINHEEICDALTSNKKIKEKVLLPDANETRKAATRLHDASAKKEEKEERKKEAGAKSGKQPQKEEQDWKLPKREGEKKDTEHEEREKDRENDQPQMHLTPTAVEPQPLQPLLDPVLSLSNELNEDIPNLLISTASRSLSSLVGMDAHMEAMSGLLDLESSNEIRVIGIWGIGGVGKTTLARYVFEQISGLFQTSFFLENVKITCQANGPSNLQEELSKNLQESLIMRSSNVGSEDIKARFGQQKVLLVADDVDNIELLDIVAKYAGRCDTGSRIIVTTRDKGLLVACGIEHVYEVECLGHSEALQLFSQYAFKRNHPYIGFEQLSDYAVKLAGGLPLALKVFGSYLHGCGKDKWENVLHRLAASTQKDVVDRATISPGELDEESKPIHGNSLSELTFAMSRDFDGLVAMDRQMKVIYRLLDLDSNSEIRMIGICGMEGVGKTTLARYAYEKISHHFQNHCFLRNIKKNYQDHGPIHLQEEFLSKILGGEALTIRNLAMGTDVIKSRLGDRKVLLVADGVDNIEQLDVVAKDGSWFGPGSRVILTTQDKSLLDKCKVNHAYEVECLRYDEALQLFSQHAFKQRHPSTAFECLSLRAVQLAGFLPLALKVLGSHLCCKHKDDWERALHRLEALLDEDTLEIQKIIYEGQESGGSAGIEPDR